MNEIENKLNIINQKLSIEIDEQNLFNILFEMNKKFDGSFVEELHRLDIKLNSYKRKCLRLYFYYGVNEFLKESGIHSFCVYNATQDDKNSILDLLIEKIEKYDENKIIKSIEERYKNIIKKVINDNSSSWLKDYYKKRNLESEFSLFILDYCQEDFVKDDYNILNIFNVVADIYSRLENYRYFIFKLDGTLKNSNHEDVTWQVLYKLSIFCENFVQFDGIYFPFKKEKKVAELKTFLDSRFKNAKNEIIAKDFYSKISTGFKFEDCLISDNQEKIILTYQKIALDNRHIKCPVCMSTIQSGNSYPEMFKRSFECKNPSCAERSKSGRGKRFDEFGTFRYFKLVENNRKNAISDELLKKWRRDIFDNKLDEYEMIIKFYSWDKDVICSNKKLKCRAYGRKIAIYIPNDKNYCNISFEDLPIYSLFKKVRENLSYVFGNVELKNDIVVFNSDSTSGVENITNFQIGTAITSPPYYNAREYSQWKNLLLYLIDMQRNSFSVYNAIRDSGYYLYNIGDIVSADNVYVSSNMSKRRLQLGFYSSMIFEINGFNLVGNIIWDKGEVQSKRNLTPNHNSGYVRSINCYEHILVFKKGNESKTISSVEKINPVIKIGHDGKNRVGHTAPYPLQLVELVKPFVDDEKYILDPFLGSGTTMVWCKQNGYKGVGFELSEIYYQLACDRIDNVKEVL